MQLLTCLLLRKFKLDIWSQWYITCRGAAMSNFLVTTKSVLTSPYVSAALTTWTNINIFRKPCCMCMSLYMWSIQTKSAGLPCYIFFSKYLPSMMDYPETCWKPPATSHRGFRSYYCYHVLWCKYRKWLIRKLQKWKHLNAAEFAVSVESSSTTKVISWKSRLLRPAVAGIRRRIVMQIDSHKSVLQPEQPSTA